MNKCFFTLLLLAILPLKPHAQLSRLGKDVQYMGEAMGSAASGNVAPFWFTNNRYGLATPHTSSGYLRGTLWRDAETDSTRHWKVGYGADIAVPFGMDGHFVLQQLYADIQWKALRLSVGQKERPLELKNQNLSSGAMTSGINARPLPQIRLELPEFWTIPRTKNWLALKAHIAYGAYTDNGWQRQFNQYGPQNLYTANSLYHTKAGFLRIGNYDKFPLSLTGGFEMSAQFAGEAWNLEQRIENGGARYNEKLPSGIKAFWNAFIPGGSDSNDGDFANKEGNQLGSWHFCAEWKEKKWNMRAYMEHFFEDESQLFWQYGWHDMLYGVEVNLPRNPVVRTLLYEHLCTTDQSGPIYHDQTATLPKQISATDEYYNHHIYGAWQHAGFVMGNPLLISPIYNNNGILNVYHNRIKSNHFGIAGQPSNEWGYRILYTNSRSLGTYSRPTLDPLRSHFWMAEITYTPHWKPNLTFILDYGGNHGRILGNSQGGMIIIRYGGCIL